MLLFHRFVEPYLEKQQLKNLAVGRLISVLKIGGFIACIELMGVYPTLVYIGWFALGPQFRFTSHYLLIGRRKYPDNPFWKQWRKFTGARLISKLVKQGLFALLTAVSMHFAIAYGICSVVGVAINHLLGNTSTRQIEA